MGIPRFYRWLSERYPLINENISSEQIPEFDNLYLDMNGIVHTSSHNNSGGLGGRSEDDVFVEVFNYIVRLFRIIQPRKLLYLAVDGCAPRAKMNQQRSRRFRAANDAREAREEALAMGEEVSDNQFDSNCITPGTDFMGRLTQHLRFFLNKQIHEDPNWHDLDVVLSGPDVPGEGEHKIMDYIRSAKAQPGYDPNMRHCLYGLDADLIMLSLASHEPHFALLREEVAFGRQAQKKLEQRRLSSRTRFQLLHISLVREYLALEFHGWDLERVVDDFVLFCVLVGNDFLPCLPLAEIGDGGLDAFIERYKEHLGAGDGWLVGDCGKVHFEELAKFLRSYAATETQNLEVALEASEWKLGMKRTVGPKKMEEEDEGPGLQGDFEEVPPTPELARVQYYEVKFGIDVQTHEGSQAQRDVFQSYLEGLQWVLLYYFRGPQSASWAWYYPYYHAPMIADLATYDRLAAPAVHFDVGAPFQPFQQLMAVLPANSKALLPECYRWLFDGEGSPVMHFYPLRFQIDIDGVRVPWGGVTLIPFIEVDALLRAMGEAERRGPPLTEAERFRNEFGQAFRYRYDVTASFEVPSSMPGRFQGLRNCCVARFPFCHPALPPGVEHFDNKPPPGCRMPAPGFPSLHLHPLTSGFDTGVKVFDALARGQSLFVHLHPQKPLVPSSGDIQKLLKAPYVLMDYPMAHRGKVVAVYTSQGIHCSDGSVRHSSPEEHGDAAWKMMSKWQQKGISIAFEGVSEEQSYDHPIVEVRPLESSYVDAQGRTQLQFADAGSHTSLHLLKERERVPSADTGGTRQLVVGASVLCTKTNSDAFGLLGVVEAAEGKSVKARFRLGLSLEEQRALESAVRPVFEAQEKAAAWWSIQDLAHETGLSLNVVKQIVGSLLAKTGDYSREDIGMSFMVQTWDNNVQSLFCLPTYAKKYKSEWFFSDLAVEALKDYAKAFPVLFNALHNKSMRDRDFSLITSFSEMDRPERELNRLMKYLGSRPWRHAGLCNAFEDHSSLRAEGVVEVARLVAGARARLEGAPIRMEEVSTAADLLLVGRQGASLPSSLRTPTQARVGLRGFVTDPFATVPSGSQGTVIGVYSSGSKGGQVLELLLDEETFGASDLRGRTPPMRGLQLPSTGFMPFSSTQKQQKGKKGSGKNSKAQEEVAEADNRVDAAPVGAARAPATGSGPACSSSQPVPPPRGPPPSRLSAGAGPSALRSLQQQQPVPQRAARAAAAGFAGSLYAPAEDWDTAFQAFSENAMPAPTPAARAGKGKGRPAAQPAGAGKGSSRPAAQPAATDWNQAFQALAAQAAPQQQQRQPVLQAAQVGRMGPRQPSSQQRWPEQWPEQEQWLQQEQQSWYYQQQQQQQPWDWYPPEPWQQQHRSYYPQSYGYY